MRIFNYEDIIPKELEGKWIYLTGLSIDVFEKAISLRGVWRDSIGYSTNDDIGVTIFKNYDKIVYVFESLEDALENCPSVSVVLEYISDYGTN